MRRACASFKSKMSHIKLSSLHQNLELSYEVHGSGKIKILFIVGLLTDGTAWFRQTEFFNQQADYQSVSYDNRGFGHSSSPLTFHYSTNQMAKDALALINHLQWNQCHVVGISMGGMIALELALIASERILSLSLLATHAGGLTSQAPFIGICHMIKSILLRDENLRIENVLSMLYSAKTLVEPDKRKSLYDYHLKILQKRISLSIIGLIGQITAVFRHYISYTDLLKIRYSPFECLIIVGDEDRVVREVNSYIIQRVLGCRLVKLDNAGHNLQDEYAQEINQELLNFFESIRKKKSSNKEISEEYATELQALELCCQHRTHCFVHDIIGFLKGMLFGIILYNLLPIIGLTKFHLVGIHLTWKSVLLLGCLNGVRRTIVCIFNAFRARYFIQKHRLQLDRAAHHGRIGVALPEEIKSGVPYGCGFEFPVPLLILIANLIGLIYLIRISE